MQTLLERCIAYPHPPKFTLEDAKTSNIDLKELYLPRYRCKTYLLELYPQHGLKRLPYTIIYTHSNGENLMMIHGLLQQISNALQARVVAPDYLGYGLTPGRPTEHSSEYIGEMTLKYVRQAHSGDRVVVWGRSIGSAVAAYLGALAGAELAAIIIESGLYSAASVVLKRNMWALACCDQFRNSGRLRSAAKAGIKLLLVHGTADEIVPLRCSLYNFFAATKRTKSTKTIQTPETVVKPPPKPQSSIRAVQGSQFTVKNSLEPRHTWQTPSAIQQPQFPLKLLKKQEQNQVTRKYNNEQQIVTQKKGIVTHVSILNGGHNDLMARHAKALLSAVIEFLGPLFASCRLDNMYLSTFVEQNTESTDRNTFFIV